MKTYYLIWDLPTRLFHWLLVSTFLAQWITAELGSEAMQYHIFSGYFMLFLLCFRLVWGLVGTRHAQFLSFFPTWSRLKSYLKPASKYDRFEPPGHNPMGASMILVMLILLFAQAISGLFITDDVYSSGPYYGVLDGDWEKLFNRLHDVCFSLLQACVAIHLAAIAFYRVAKKKNLVLPMVTGKKSSEDVGEEDAINNSKLIIAVIVASAVAAFTYWLVVTNAPLIEDYYYY